MLRSPGADLSPEGWADLAKARGRWADVVYAKGGTTPVEVVDRLMNAADSAHTSLRLNAKEMVQQMGQRDWVITAGPHRTTATKGGKLDNVPHITLEVNGMPHAYHLRLDKRGHIFEIRTMRRTGNKLRPDNPVANTPRPWQGPGQ